MTGESISFSKKIAKHQAALEALINVQKYTGNRDLENFIRSYVCGGASILCLKSIFPGQEKIDFQYEGIEGRRRSRSRARSCSRSRARSRSRAKSSSRCGNEGQRRSRSCSRARGRSPFRGSDKFGGGCQMACAPMGETNAVKCLEEECKLSGIPAPEYSPHFQGRTGELVVVAKLGPFTSKGTGKTRESAKQAAAAALIDSFFDDN
uniref:DRBM domain-containing protein n=1 Tax=Rhodnius prolixus TaxID=13249 RepID=T1HFJ0_RHOPR